MLFTQVYFWLSVEVRDTSKILDVKGSPIFFRGFRISFGLSDDRALI